MINRERLLEEFLELVRIPSPSGREKAMADLLVAKLAQMGLQVTVDDAGDKVGGQTGNVIGRLKGTVEAPTILFSAHMDTVTPCDAINPIVKNDTVYSDGTSVLGADDKGGITAILEALRVLKENSIPHGDVEVIFSIWEEGGLKGAFNLDTSALRAKHGYVLDSGGDVGQIITSGPAQDKIDAVIRGRSAHAGVAPEEGVSAIMIAARAIDRMNLLRIDPETTANVGYIMGGGATNIVTPEVTIRAEARSLDQEKLDRQSRHMVQCLEEAASHFGGSAEVTVTRAYPPFRLDDQHPTVAMVKRALERMGVTPTTTSTGGGSDTNVLNSKGIPSVNLGVGMRKVHTLEEHIHVKDLETSARMVLEIIRSFAGA